MNPTLLNPDTQLVQTSDLMTSQMDGETVMMSLERSAYFGLDAIGSRIWQLLAEPMRVADLCARLQEEYDVDAATCQRDVFAFLEQLLAQGLIRVV